MGLLSRTAANTVWLALPMAILASLLLAALFGLLVLRSRGVYFMMLILALAQVVWGIAFSWRSVTGGDDGLPGISRPMVGLIVLDTSGSFYLFVLIIFVVSAAILLLIVNSPFGLSLEGIREGAPRMSALGYNVWLHQYLAFITAGALQEPPRADRLRERHYHSVLLEHPDRRRGAADGLVGVEPAL